MDMFFGYGLWRGVPFSPDFFVHIRPAVSPRSTPFLQFLLGAFAFFFSGAHGTPACMGGRSGEVPAWIEPL